ncbi:RNA polymerase sigma factor [Micromonospora parathelypteridis]|uniref:RNA polymerase sigma-70 factor (ECF subfamily) n=1 Tax=Micromonospora parathelypteridis TaxID=1839617 RepID=A0A840VQW5_9ACTN|nr:sigma-70 family RNA polymerase sigma factor [Micromonospora parathelypteridis]MBB5476404.1 RNA polymerase sigma-70 factor (ECF subfamily) [Micromonospora parathelypteridis]GGO15007.1 RNA polymerase subunit sigma-24 [Micromonospora parathelypteridis]
MSTPQRRPSCTSAPADAAAAEAVAAASVEAYPRIVAALIRVTGDWALAEDCAQEALTVALERWPDDGVPNNPGGWLMTVARNRALDVLRRATVERRKLHDLALLTPAETQPEPEVGADVVDDRLRLIFTCCHPALAMEARVALTLRTVCGVPTVDIARLLLVSESTMTRRLTRARTRIAQAGIPYRVPSGPALPERLPGVLAVLYLLFTRGYVADGEPAFADEAVRLARLLDRLMPEQSEVAALLALFLFQHSRAEARRDAAGNLLTLQRQDRRRWDRAAITEGLAALERVRHDGPYAWQARIAACHATATSADSTDWPAIARAYDALIGIQPSPVIALNRAVAHSHAYGPAAGLGLLDAAHVGGGLDGNPLAVAVRADLVARQGDRTRGAILFREAAARVGSAAERRALLDRADELAP